MIDVMKQALEALEAVRWSRHLEDARTIAKNARYSLRQAIEQAEKDDMYRNPDTDNPCEGWDTSDMAHRSGGLSVEQEKLCKYCRGIGRVVCDGRCMPEQEPVSWAETNDLVCALLRQAHDVLACASYPFKRPWVSLTDEEIDYIWGISPGDYEDKFAFPRAIEVKLRERNA